MSKINKHITITISIILFAMGIVSVLAWISLKPLREKNGFTRKFSGNRVSHLNDLETSNQITDVAGFGKNSIFFETRTPGLFWETDQNLGSKKSYQLALRSSEKLSSAFFSLVDSPDCYIMANNLATVIRSRPGATLVSTYPSLSIFTRAVNINRNSIVFRGFDPSVKTYDQIFYKKDLSTNAIKKEDTPILEKKHDAGVSTDGWLNYDSSLHILTYVLYYQNSFVCLDTNLNLIYQKHTIDTINSYQLKAAMVGKKASSRITNITPTRNVNQVSEISGGRLYNISRIKADNENSSDFMSNSVVDTYDIKNGTYISSFYLPNYRREKLTHFRIYGDKIIVLYKTYCVSYKLI